MRKLIWGNELGIGTLFNGTVRSYGQQGRSKFVNLEAIEHVITLIKVKYD